MLFRMGTCRTMRVEYVVALPFESIWRLNFEISIYYYCSIHVDLSVGFDVGWYSQHLCKTGDLITRIRLNCH